MATKNEGEVLISLINMNEVRKKVALTVVGTSPLIVHAWSEKAKKEMLGKQAKKTSTGKEAKVPLRDYVNALYFLDDAGNLMDVPEEFDGINSNTTEEEVQEMLSKYRFGFPTVAFKAAMIDTAYQQGLIAKKTTIRGAVRILGEYAVIDGIPTMREDMVRIGGANKVADIRYRPEFKEWKTTLVFEYLENSISLEQIVNYLNYGGFAGGIGEWRPARDGSYGTFQVSFQG